MTEVQAALTRVPGFRAVGVTCGLKVSGKPDLALVLADRPCTAAAVFTSNRFKAAPVLYDLALLQRAAHSQRGVVINAGNANAITGTQGLRNAAAMAQQVETRVGLPSDSILVMSTGVIGEPLPMDKVGAGIRQASELIEGQAGAQGLNAVQAIMTTDLVPKEAFVQITIGGRVVSLAGMAKGSGMIHPDMATMLAVLVTDAVIEPSVLDKALRLAVDRSFHRVTVDGDTSTNDTVLVLASGGAGHPLIVAGSPDFQAFVAGLSDLCVRLAKAIARDGEGATKLIEITVRGARTEAEAAAAARTIAISPLFKTAVFGNDPNWGRVLMALGRARADFDPQQVSLWLGDFHLVDRSEPLEFNETAAHHWLAASTEINLLVDLALGQGQATVWTCDYSYKYVEINAEYHT